MRISPKKYLFFGPLSVFFIASFIWFLILSQTIDFITGLVILIFFSFLAFWRGLLAFRHARELFGLRNKKQIFTVALVVTLCFGEIIWAISFLPLRFFILGGLFAIIFTVAFNILKEYFKQNRDLPDKPNDGAFKKLLTKNIILGVIIIIVLISISSWLPPKTF